MDDDLCMSCLCSSARRELLLPGEEAGREREDVAASSWRCRSDALGFACGCGVGAAADDESLLSPLGSCWPRAAMRCLFRSERALLELLLLLELPPLDDDDEGGFAVADDVSDVAPLLQLADEAAGDGGDLVVAAAATALALPLLAFAAAAPASMR